MEVNVDITLKPDVLDPQGQAILSNLHLLGFSRVARVRCHKVIECDVQAATPQEAKAMVHDMCQALLVNQVIEDYRIDLPNDVS